MKINNKKDSFKFWFPVELSKGKDKEGNDIMKIGGVASTIDRDSDGEMLDPEGFDLSILKKSGMINWHHKSAEDPSAIIGEPTLAEIRKGQLYIEGMLYPDSPKAKKVYELAQTLESNSKTRRLGFSIEGKAIERDVENPKKILKAAITGVAITHSPKNPNTLLNIIKGEYDEAYYEDEYIEEDEEGKTKKKALSTDSSSGKALMPESVEGSTKHLTKSEVFEEIFSMNSVIDMSSAKEIFNLAEKISNMKNKNKVTKITKADIVKAHEVLGIPTDEILKGEVNEEEEVDDDDEEEVVMKKGRKKSAEKIEKSYKKAKKAEDEDEEDEEDEDEGIEKSLEDQLGESKGLGRIEKAIEVSSKMTESRLEKRIDSLSKAIGAVMYRQNQIIKSIQEGQSNLTEKLEEFVEETNDNLGKALDGIVELAEQESGPKSLTASSFKKSRMDENFEKANNGGKTKISISDRNSRGTILNYLDNLTFEKGFDEEMAKAMTSFETTGGLSEMAKKRIESNFNIEIVR